MTVKTEFDPYVEIDGTDVSAYVTNVTIGDSVEETDITHGSGTTHRERQVGLRGNTFSATLVYNIENIDVIRALCKSGVKTVVFGPHGNVAGRPKHEQDFLFASVELSQSVEQNEALRFPLSGNSSGAPVTDMYGTGTW